LVEEAKVAARTQRPKEKAIREVILSEFLAGEKA